MNIKPPNFNAEKAVEVILYISSKTITPDIYHVGKILYFADKEHLEKFGRLICNDSYVAMKNGPVPSETYDIIKAVRDDLIKYSYYEHAANSFFIKKGSNMITPLRKQNDDLLSQSDKECLDHSIQKYGSLSFNELKRFSHDAAFRLAGEDDFIPIENIIRTLNDGNLLLEHFQKTY